MQKAGLAIGLRSIFSNEINMRWKTPSITEYQAGVNEGLSRADEAFGNCAERFIVLGDVDREIWREGCLAVFNRLLQSVEDHGDPYDEYTCGVNDGLRSAREAFLVVLGIVCPEPTEPADSAGGIATT